MKIKANKIYIIAISIIIISFILPVAILKQDKNFFGLSIYTEVPKRVIKTDIKNIYLVNAIHEIGKATEKVLVDPKSKEMIEYTTYSSKTNIEKEIQDLASYDIIENILEKKYDYGLEISPKYLTSNDVNYIINEFSIIVDKIEYSFEIEEKSGKILSMYINKDIINSNLPKEEILMKYVKYLGLDIIDDWKYEDEWLSSDKADVIVTAVQNELENKCLISFHSKEILKN